MLGLRGKSLRKRKRKGKIFGPGESLHELNYELDETDANTIDYAG